MRVLAVVTFQPWPVRSGITRRLDALLRALHAASDLRVLVAAEPGAPDDVPPGMRVERVTRSRSHAASLREVARGVPAGRTVTAAFYRRGNVRAALRDAVAAHRPDVVVTHGFGGAALCAGVVPEGRTVLDADTIDPETYRRLAADTPGPRGWQWAVDVPLGTRWHRRYLGRFAGVTVVSEDDAARYARLAPGARLVTVPNGVDLPPAPRPDPGGRRLLFLGDLTYPPNRNGLDWYVREVLPGVSATLRVVGGGEAPVAPRVEAAGLVPDVAAEWAAATALVVPLRSGGGTRLKVLEAFAHGVPVVSTAIGVEGVGAEPDVHYVRADTAAELAAASERVLGDAALRARLAASARELAAAYTWERCTAPLVDLVADVAP